MEYIKYLFFENHPKSIQALCLSAGAVKGIYQLGACHYLATQNKLESINTFIGTSVGSAVAFMLAIGYEPLDFFSKICTDDINKCWEYDISLRQIVLDWGAINHKKFKEYVEECIIEKLGFLPTFEQFYFLTGKIFICSAWCLTSEQHKTYFNFLNTPDILISDAIIASCAIPGIFTKVKINNHYYIDGGIFDCCPIEYLFHFLTVDCHYKSESIKECYILFTKSEVSNPNLTINNLFDYIREISYIPFLLQKQFTEEYVKKKFQSFIKPEYLNYIELICEYDEITLSVPVQNKIKNFCSGYEQMKNKLIFSN